MATDDPLLNSASYLLLKAGRFAIAEFDSLLAELQLSYRDGLVLAFIAGGDGLSQQELSRCLGLDPTLIVGLVDGLEERGLVERGRDPGDRRRYRLTLTDAGHALHERAVASVSVQDGLLGPLDDDERAQLRLLLIKVLTPHLTWLR